jgi:hypothetical protein
VTKAFVAALGIAAAALAMVTTLGAAPAPTQSCSVRNLVFPGGGPLEWKPTGKFKHRIQGTIGIPVAVSGRTLIVTGVKSIAGKKRHGLAAIDMRTGRILPFDPVLPSSHFTTALAASASTVYVGHGPDSGSATEIDAFRLSTGSPVPSFAPPDFRTGLIESIVYAGGSVVIGGAQDDSPVTLGAYHPVTGAARWRQELPWKVREIVTDGSRLYIAIPPGSPGYRPIGAFDAKSGERVAGWGASLPARQQQLFLYGVDATRVFGSYIHGPIVVKQKDGSAVKLPQLPPRSEPHGGIARTIVGRIKIRGIFVGAVFSPTGKLIGTACTTNTVLAQADDRHLIASQRSTTGFGESLVELAAP